MGNALVEESVCASRERTGGSGAMVASNSATVSAMKDSERRTPY
jgi:hypothetical protein